MKRYLVYGAGGHALVVMDTAELCGFEITGFIDDFDHNEDHRVQGKPVYAPEVITENDVVFMGFGDNKMRQQIGESLLARGIEVRTLVHPSAIISRYAQVGVGCYIGANVIIDPGCEIGDFVIANNNSVISHNSVIGAATNVCPGAMCAGWCTVGKRCLLGIGTIVRERIIIADDVRIGGGAVVVKDFTETGVLAYGVPAKQHPPSDK